MSSRERKRTDRRKRKQRAAAQPEAEATAAAETTPDVDDAEAAEALAAASNGATHSTADEEVESIAAEAERRGISKSEIRNERARAELEPLEKGERPGIVTIGALVSLAIAISILIGWAAGVKVSSDNSDIERKANAFQVIPPALLFLIMAWGMWGARYWAVLGFEAIMAIIMVGAFLTLIAATTIFKAVSAFIVLVAVGALFWFTVKALARIQMPTPRESGPR